MNSCSLIIHCVHTWHSMRLRKFLLLPHFLPNLCLCFSKLSATFDSKQGSISGKMCFYSVIGSKCPSTAPLIFYRHGDMYKVSQSKEESELAVHKLWIPLVVCFSVRHKESQAFMLTTEASAPIPPSSHGNQGLLRAAVCGRPGHHKSFIRKHIQSLNRQLSEGLLFVIKIVLLDFSLLHCFNVINNLFFWSKFFKKIKINQYLTGGKKPHYSHKDSNSSLSHSNQQFIVGWPFWYLLQMGTVAFHINLTPCWGLSSCPWFPHQNLGLQLSAAGSNSGQN